MCSRSKGVMPMVLNDSERPAAANLSKSTTSMTLSFAARSLFFLNVQHMLNYQLNRN